MKKCETCNGYGIEEVPLPNGDREVVDCEACNGHGVILETDEEAEAARIAGICYE